MVRGAPSRRALLPHIQRLVDMRAKSDQDVMKAIEKRFEGAEGLKDKIERKTHGLADSL